MVNHQNLGLCGRLEWLVGWVDWWTCCHAVNQALQTGLPSLKRLVPFMGCNPTLQQFLFTTSEAYENVSICLRSHGSNPSGCFRRNLCGQCHGVQCLPATVWRQLCFLASYPFEAPAAASEKRQGLDSSLDAFGGHQSVTRRFFVIFSLNFWVYGMLRA